MPLNPSVSLALKIIESAAVAGERAPLTKRPGITVGALDQAHTSRLIADGYIRVDVYSKNYRVITLLKGEHAGKSTRLPGHGGKPYATYPSVPVSVSAAAETQAEGASV